MKRVLLLLLIPVLAACSSSGISSGNEQSFVSGDGTAIYIKAAARSAAPTIAGPTLDGSTFTSPSGKVVVLNVWASWCSPCRAEAPTLQELSKRMSDVQFVGVLTRDNLVSARSFVSRFGISYPTLTDDSILARFRGAANAIPTTLVIDKKGRVAGRISGEVTFAGLSELITKVAGE